MKCLWILTLSFLPAVVPHTIIGLNQCLCFTHQTCHSPNSGNECRSYFTSSSYGCLSAAVERSCPDGEMFDILSCGCTSSDAAVCSSECLPPHDLVPAISTTTPAVTTSTLPPTTTSSYTCPEGWIKSPSNKCYKFVTDLIRTWEEANDKCRVMDSLMAAPRTSSEIKWIRDYKEDNSDLQDRMWLGGYKRLGAWRWQDAHDQPIEVTDWGVEEPSGFENCLQLFEGSRYRDSSPNRWNDVSCSQKMNFICEKDSGYETEESSATTSAPTIITQPSTRPHGVCPGGWVKSPTRCYKFVTTPEYDWTSANRQCHIRNGYLAAPKTLSEMKWIRDYRESNYNFQGRTWIGGYKQDGQWWWSGVNATLIERTDWAAGEPSISWFGMDENCMNLLEGSSIRSDPEVINRWNDAPCDDDTLGFLCERGQEELSNNMQTVDVTASAFSSMTSTPAASSLTSTPTTDSSVTNNINTEDFQQLCAALESNNVLYHILSC